MSEKHKYALGAFVAAVFLNFAMYSQVFNNASTLKVILLCLFFIGFPMVIFIYYLFAVIEDKTANILGFTFHAVYMGTSLAMHISFIFWILALDI